MWDRVIDVADIVTAVSAVAGVVVAAVLGFRGIQIARRDVLRGEREFVTDRAHELMRDGTEFVHASEKYAQSCQSFSDVTSPADASWRNLSARIDTLIELDVLDEDHTNLRTSLQFIWMLRRVSEVVHKLHSQGRSVIAWSVFSGADDHARVLPWLAERVHGHEFYEKDGYTFTASDGMHVSSAFDGSSAVAETLARKLHYNSEIFSLNESIRIVIPWILLESGWINCGVDPEDGTIAGVRESDWGAYFDPSRRKLVVKDHEFPAVRDWLDFWLRHRFGRMEDHGAYSADNPQGRSVTPEEIGVALVQAMGAELMSQLRLVIRSLKPGYVVHS